MKLVDWPEHPSISLKNFKFRYQDKLPLILKGISFDIKAG
jgi:ABC-type bacteriocin/lantibiotic exporter with double-glycine peptidase domain